MPRLTSDQWDTIRAEREAGASFGELASRHGISKPAIIKRSQAEGWGDGRDVGEVVRRKVTEKVTGVDRVADPQKVAAAIDATANRAADVVRRHQNEPMGPRELIERGLRQAAEARNREQKEIAMLDLKAAKLAAEGLALVQGMERKSFGLDSANPAGNDKPTAVTVYLPSNER